MNIKRRLILLNILFLLGIGGVLGIMSFYHQQQVSFDRLILEVHQFRGSIYHANSKLKNIVIGDELKEEWERFFSSYQEMEKKLRGILESELYIETVTGVKEIEDRSDAMKNVLADNKERVDELRRVVETLRSRYPDFLPGLYRASSYYNDAEVNEALRKAKNLTIYFSDNMESLVDKIDADISKGAAILQRRVQLLAFAVSGGIVVAVLLSSVFILLYLKRRLDGIAQEMELLAGGDLSSSLNEDARDELSTIAVSINSFIHEFSSIIRQIKELSSRSGALEEEVTDASNQSASAVSEMGENIHEIAERIGTLVEHLSDSKGSLEGISRSVNELTDRIESQSSAVTESSSSIEEMNASIENVATIAKKRKEVSEELVKFTGEAGEKVRETDVLIQQNSQDTEEILKIIAIINNIAGQTNLLSMNAAIEAAHAGDAGRGFAVVAEEIRGLAENSNKNAKRIKETINTLTERIRTVHDVSNASIEAFERIEKDTKESSNAMEEISSSMDELSQGSREIMDAVNSLAGTTDEIREEAEQIQENTGTVNGSLEEIRQIGENVNNSIKDIETSSEDISSSMHQVTELNVKNSEAIIELEEAIKTFKTEADREDGDTSDDEGENDTGGEEEGAPGTG